jgi:hypothetical protein
MRLARILVGAWLVLGGFTACSDHNPTVVFVGDAGADGKSEAGAAQDGGGSHDGGVAVAADTRGLSIDVPSALDLAQETSSAVDVANTPDVNRAADVNQAIDLPTVIDTSRAIDGAGQTLDGSGGTALDLGVDSSAASDGGGTGG